MFSPLAVGVIREKEGWCEICGMTPGICFHLKHWTGALSPHPPNNRWFACPVLPIAWVLAPSLCSPSCFQIPKQMALSLLVRGLANWCCTIQAKLIQEQSGDWSFSTLQPLIPLFCWTLFLYQPHPLLQAATSILESTFIDQTCLFLVGQQGLFLTPCWQTFLRFKLQDMTWE